MQEFKDAMRGLCQTIGIVTACEGGRWVGMTASSIVSVSMDPPSVLVCVNKGASIHPVISRSRRFNINFLTEGQQDISRHFSSPIPNEERFRQGRWAAAEGQPPVLAGAQSVLCCDLGSAAAFATHTIFVGQVREVKREEAALPLVYMNGSYHTFRRSGQAVCS